MANQKTRGDALRNYLTGAASAGAAQTDQALSLGNHRSATEIASLGISITSPIANITVDFAGGGNALGAGTLTCVDANTLKWKDLGGVYGDPVIIANGETKLVEAYTRPGAFLRVSRTSATGLVPGDSTITLAEIVNNLFGLSNVPSASAIAGLTTYRGIIIRNESPAAVAAFKRYLSLLGTSCESDTGQLGASGAGTISTGDSFEDWPVVGYCRIETSSDVLREIVYYTSRTNSSLNVPAAGRGILSSTPAAGAASDKIYPVSGVAIAVAIDGTQSWGDAIATIANETTAPSGVTWKTGIRAADGINFGDIGFEQQVGMWIKRHIPAGAYSFPNHRVVLSDTFEAV